MARVTKDNCHSSVSVVTKWEAVSDISMRNWSLRENGSHLVFLVGKESPSRLNLEKEKAVKFFFVY